MVTPLCTSGFASKFSAQGKEKMFIHKSHPSEYLQLHINDSIHGFVHAADTEGLINTKFQSFQTQGKEGEERSLFSCLGIQTHLPLGRFSSPLGWEGERETKSPHFL